MGELLQIKNLHTYFYTDTGIAPAVEGVSLAIDQGQTLALVGESGCGKTVTALSIMRLVPAPGKITSGEILFQGKNLLSLSESRMRAIRGKDIGMVFQEPMSALNPLYPIGYQIAEVFLAHQKMEKKQRKERVIELLAKVEIPSPQERYSDYPHSLSGGLRQRAMIAQSLAAHPRLLIADEPTTALDVTIQAQILQLFTRLQQDKQMSILLITHDLGIVAEVADRVCIMYAGMIVEEADVFTIFDQPKHPYTQGLLNSSPARAQSGQRPLAIPGSVPHPAHKPIGCAFHPRCHLADSGCKVGLPAFVELEKGHKVRCFKAGKQ